MNFKDVAHKTVAELFDMLKAKVAAIQEMDEVIKLQDADLRKYEKQIESLKEQLNNMEASYIEKKKQVESCVALVGEWRETHIGGWSDYARGSLHSRQDCIDDLEKALRGANETHN